MKKSELRKIVKECLLQERAGGYVEVELEKAANSISLANGGIHYALNDKHPMGAHGAHLSDDERKKLGRAFGSLEHAMKMVNDAKKLISGIDLKYSD